MITLFTGLPGAGKSATMVELLTQLVERERTKKDGEPPRPIYAHGIPGLNVPGVLELEHPDAWESLPVGSIVMCDEIQRSWPSSKQSEPTPPQKALSVHRHRGMDFFFGTQRPTMLSKWVRGLVEVHIHLERKHGTKIVKQYRFEPICEDVNSMGRRRDAIVTARTLPAHVFGLYKSAELHTVKARIPKIAYALIAVPLICALAVWGGIGSVWGRSKAHGAQAEETAATLTSGNAPEAPGRKADKPNGSEPRFRTAEDWIAYQTPRVEGIPWSAPMFDDEKPTSVPMIYCMSTPRRCVCRTEQGARLSVNDATCRRVAIEGLHNPFKRNGPLRG